MNLNKREKEALRWIVTLLEQHHIEYEILGGLGAKIYGSQRQLNDIDINIGKDDYEKLRPLVQGYIKIPLEYYQDENGKLEEVTLDYKGQEIEIGLHETIFLKNKVTGLWLAFDDHKFIYELINYDGLSLHVQTKENLIKSKKLCNRPQDREDLEQIMNK